jgi:nicotinamidase-related amidase
VAAAPEGRRRHRRDRAAKKPSDDGLAGTGLAPLLADRGIRCLALCGLLPEMCVAATACTTLSLGFQVVIPHTAHATYDVPAAPGSSDAVPAALVSRVAEWALGDQVDVVATAADVEFTHPRPAHAKNRRPLC